MVAPSPPIPSPSDAAVATLSPPGSPSLPHADDGARGAPLLEALMAETPRPSRLGLVPGSGAVFATAAALTLAAIALAIGTRAAGLPAGWSRLFDNLHWTIADLGAMALAWLGVRDARRRGLPAEGRARRWFALGFTAYAIGQLLWGLQNLYAWQPFPAPSDAFYLLLAPCCMAGMAAALRGRVSPAQRLAATLDTLSLAVAAVALALMAYLPERGDIGGLALGVMVAYPTLLLAAACVGLMLIALLRVGRAWPAWALTVMLAAHGGLWMAWNTMALAHVIVDGSLIGSAFSAFTLLGALAASSWHVERKASARVDRFCEGALRVLPLAVVVGVTCAVTLQHAAGHASPTVHFVCDAAAVLVILLAALRQTLQLRDRDQLLDAQRQLSDREHELSELNQHLERRVSERTHEVEQRNAELSTALAQLSTVQQQLAQVEALAGLGALVKGVAAETAASLANADMVALTLPGQVDALGRLHAAPVDVAGEERRRGQLATLLRGLDESHKQFALSMHHAQQVVTDFQQIAIDRTGGQRRHFELLDAVRQMVALTRLAHRHDPVEIIVTGEDKIALDSHPGALGQVLDELIANAIAHGFARKGEGTISIRVWPSGDDAARVTVQDDGAGIEDNALPQAFAPAFGGGLARRGGRGLATVRDLVQGLLGGQLEIASSPGAGTTVTLTLARVAPRLPGQAPPAPGRRPSAAQRRGGDS